ncbi:hypothetical protein IT571_02060 [Candidatus Sumerlaeota bacterium]|nr:hypothetical protein [Candidatus Sumerlaeota bacterium]
MKKNSPLILVAILAALPITGFARTKLVTLPDRAKLVTSLENPRFTLLYEEREIPLQQGTNYVDFAWNGVSIDANSVMIELLTNPGDGDTATKIIATGFPPNEQALTWQLYSPAARTERIRVSYLLNGISQDTSYEIRMNQKETAGDFQQYFRMQNASGEDLDNAIVRLPLMDDLTRSMDSGEVRRFLASRVPELPIKKVFIARPGYDVFLGEDGENIDLVYEIENKTEAGLGKYKLPNGKARLYGDDGMNSSIFLGEDMLRQTPPKEKAELTLGKVKDVVLKRRLMKDERTNVKTNNRKETVMFDQVRQVRYEIENFKEEPVTLKINETLNGDWEIQEITEAGVKTERKSLSELVVSVDLPANKKGEKAEKKVVDITFVIKNRFPGEK